MNMRSLAVQLSKAPLQSLPPSMESIHGVTQNMLMLLFPDRPLHRKDIQRHLTRLKRDIKNLVADALATHRVHHGQDADVDVSHIADHLVNALPQLRKKAEFDIAAALRSDPAARDAAEVIRYYPGFRAILLHRIAHVLHQLHVPYIPRGISEHAHTETGIDIHPGAAVGDSFFIDHGTGVVIGETAHIGKNVKLYQGVTLGAVSLPQDNTDKTVIVGKRHPTVEDRVTIYANATVLGGQTVIGHDSVIGANAWIRESLPPFSKIGIDPSRIHGERKNRH